MIGLMMLIFSPFCKVQIWKLIASDLPLMLRQNKRIPSNNADCFTIRTNDI